MAALKMNVTTAKDRLLMAWLATVVFLYPISHVIALRNLVLAVGLMVIVLTLRHAPKPSSVPQLKASAWALAALTVWLAIHSGFIAEHPAQAFDELRGNWLQPLLIAALGALAAARLSTLNALRSILLPLFAHLLWVLLHQLVIALQTGHWPLGEMPFAERDYQSLIVGFLAALVIAERLAWVVCQQSPLNWSRQTGWLLLAFTLAGDTLIRTRNGMVVIVVLVCVALAASLFSLHLRLRWRGLLLVGVLLVGGLVTLSIQGDSRWSRMSESMVVGWNDANRTWVSEDIVKKLSTASGGQVEESAYMRATWARESLSFLRQQPLGIGFGPDAFGRVVQKRYGASGWGSSHSGWLDFAIGTGFPGLLLLIATAGLAVWGGWRKFWRDEDGVGLMFSFLVGGYMLRCLLDGHLSGWRLGLFSLLAGVLIGCMKRRTSAA
jgi:hypothetical protein